MSGDNAAHDDGDPGNPLKVERSVALPYVPESVTGARQGLCADLRSLEICPGRVDDAALILSELVSNALRHASPLPEHTVGVSWRVEVNQSAPAGGWLEIAVRDGGASTMPRVARPSLSGLGGRGLGIVQTLAGRWGTEMDATTTMVWAVLEIAEGDVSPGPSGVVTDLPVPFTDSGDTLGSTADVVELDIRARENEPA